MAQSGSLLTDAELHGLVDGHIEVGRRADVLRRLAMSPADRSLVESWQQQTDLIRAAFRDVDRESLPVALDLAPPRLRCVAPVAPPAPRQAAQTRYGGVAAAVTLCVVTAGLLGSWLMIAQAGRDEDASTGTAQTSLAEKLAERTAGVTIVARTPDMAGPPAFRIPDLSQEGFVLTEASTQETDPATLVLRYRGSRDGRVALGVTRAATGTEPSEPTPVGDSLVWRQHDAVYALAGTLPSDKLRSLAATLRTAMNRN